jgi:hypothetical protein
MRPEVNDTLQVICDSLRAADIEYSVDHNFYPPDAVSIAAIRKDGSGVIAIVGWDKGEIVHVLYDHSFTIPKTTVELIQRMKGFYHED